MIISEFVQCLEFTISNELFCMLESLE